MHFKFTIFQCCSVRIAHISFLWFIHHFFFFSSCWWSEKMLWEYSRQFSTNKCFFFFLGRQLKIINLIISHEEIFAQTTFYEKKGRKFEEKFFENSFSCQFSWLSKDFWFLSKHFREKKTIKISFKLISKIVLTSRFHRSKSFAFSCLLADATDMNNNNNRITSVSLLW